MDKGTAKYFIKGSAIRKDHTRTFPGQEKFQSYLSKLELKSFRARTEMYDNFLHICNKNVKCLLQCLNHFLPFYVRQ